MLPLSRLSKTLPALAFIALLASCSSEAPKDPLLMQAESGDAQAQYEWATRLAQAEPTRPQATEWLEKAARSGHAEARLQLIKQELEQSGSSEISAEALGFLEELAEQSKLEALLLLGQLYLEGRGIEKDRDKAFACFDKAAAQGHPHARFQRARMLWEQASPDLSTSAFKRELYDIATKGEPLAYGILGRVIEKEGDLKTAEQNYFLAAQAGDLYSMYRSGVAYHRNGNNPQYAPQGYQWLLQAAQSGIDEALVPLARAYAAGLGVAENADESLRLYRIAAWLGHHEATSFLARTLIRKKMGGFDTALDNAALLATYPDLPEESKEWLSNLIPFSSKPFKRLASLRAQQLQNAIKTYAPSELASFAFPSIAPLFEAYGADAELLKRAISGTDAQASLQIALNFLSPDSPSHNLSEAIEWLQEAVAQGEAQAAWKLYELFQDPIHATELTAIDVEASLLKASRLDPQVSLLLAQNYQTGSALAKQSSLLAIEHAHDAYKKGIAEAMQIIEDLLLNDPSIDLDASSVRPYVAQLAKDGNQRFIFHLAVAGLSKGLSYKNDSLLPPTNVIMNLISPLKIGERNLGDKSKKWVEQTDPAKLSIKMRRHVMEIDSLAASGYPPAQELLSQWLLAGAFLEADPDRAVDLLEQVVARDDASALAHYYWSSVLMRGYKREADFVKGSIHYRKCAELGQSTARKYFSDLSDAKDDPYDGYVELAYRASELQDSKAMVRLAKYLKGYANYNEEKQKAEYSKWLSQAAKMDDVEALSTIGMAYFKGQDGLEKNPLRGIRYLERCAQLGDASAQFNCGAFLMVGKDIERDIPRGMDYLQQAAKGNEPRAKRLIATLEKAYPGRVLTELSGDELFNFLRSAISDNDVFPISLHIAQKGELFPVTGASRKRATLSDKGKERGAAADSKPIFLASEDWHPARLDVTQITITAPWIFTENSLIYTGADPSITFHLTAKQSAKDVFCLLIIKQQEKEIAYEWRPVGNLESDKERRISFDLESAFRSQDDISLHFFSEGKELLSDIRKQPNHFIRPELDAFTQARTAYVSSNDTKTTDPRQYASFSSFIYGATHFPEGSYAVLDVNKEGFIAAARFSDNLDADMRQSLLEILPFVTFLPRIQDGTAIPFKVKAPIL